MRLFRRAAERPETPGGLAKGRDAHESPDPPGEPPISKFVAPAAGREAPASTENPEIRVSRTVVKSEPELTELVAREPRLRDERVRVTMVEKGFGTRVAIVTPAGNGLERADLERLLDQLAVPQKRPFSNA